MNDLFGLWPIYKIIGTSLILFFFSFFFGKIYLKSYTDNKAVHFIFGLLIDISIVAIYITKGKTIFLSFLLLLMIFYKSSNIDWKKLVFGSIRDTSFVILLLIIFIGENLIRYNYFSSEYIYAGYPDYPYYLMLAESLMMTGVESFFNYLEVFGISTTANIYHYFDIYILIPYIFSGIPSTSVYLFFFKSFIAALGVFVLGNFFSHITQNRKFYSYLIAYFVVHYVGLSIDGFQIELEPNFIYNIKAIYVLILILFFHEWYISKNTIYCSLILVCSFLFNPLLTPIVTVVILILLLTKKLNWRKNIFNGRNILFLIFLCINIIWLYFYNSQSSNKLLLDIEREQIQFISFSYIEGAFNRFLNYLIGGFKSHILIVAVILQLLYILYLKKHLDFRIYIASLMFFMGHIFNSLLFYHAESSQFYSIPFICLAIIFVYYGIVQVFNSDKNLRYSSFIIILFLIGSFIISGFKSFHRPQSYYKNSVAFVDETLRSLNSPAKIIYFEDYDKFTLDNWRRVLPHLSFGVGNLKLNSFSFIIQPTLTDFFEPGTLPIEAEISIKRGPFQMYCTENNFHPSSYEDQNFFIALKGFIEQKDIDCLVFDKNIRIPNWIEELEVKKIIKPVKKYDNLVLYVL